MANSKLTNKLTNCTNQACQFIFNIHSIYFCAKNTVNLFNATFPSHSKVLEILGNEGI